MNIVIRQGVLYLTKDRENFSVVRRFRKEFKECINSLPGRSLRSITFSQADELHAHFRGNVSLAVSFYNSLIEKYAKEGYYIKTRHLVMAMLERNLDENPFYDEDFFPKR